MRRIPALLTVVGLTALILTGCSTTADSAASCERPTASDGVLGLIDVSVGDAGPTVKTDAPVYTDSTVFRDVEQGDGTVVTSDVQEVQFSVSMVNGTTGESLAQGGTQLLTVGSWSENYAGLAEMLRCASAGTRMLGAVPYSGFSPEAAASLGLAEGQSAVVALNLQTVVPAAADGTPQSAGSSRMPSVVLAPDGRPGIILPAAEPPTELAVEVLKKGDGPVLDENSTPRVQYTGVTWAEGTVFDSSWEKGASAAFPLTGVIPGLADALKGQTVGSQILVVIPPDQGYQDQELPSIPAGSTLVFVVDILGLETPAE